MYTSLIRGLMSSAQIRQTQRVDGRANDGFRPSVKTRFNEWPRWMLTRRVVVHGPPHPV